MTNYEQEFWSALQAKTEMAMLVPESQTALIAEKQKLTDAQKYIITGLNYSTETYTKLADLPKIENTKQKNYRDENIKKHPKAKVTAKEAALKRRNHGLDR